MAHGIKTYGRVLEVEGLEFRVGGLRLGFRPFKAFRCLHGGPAQINVNVSPARRLGSSKLVAHASCFLVQGAVKSGLKTYALFHSSCPQLLKVDLVVQGRHLKHYSNLDKLLGPQEAESDASFCCIYIHMYTCQGPSESHIRRLKGQLSNWMRLSRNILAGFAAYHTRHPCPEGT